MTIGLLRSVYLIEFGQTAGTCFTLDVDAKQYLVTAAHVVQGIKTGDKVRIFRGGGSWEEVSVIPVQARSSKIDIAVLIPERAVTDPSMTLEAGSVEGLNMIQEVYFLGFPYGGRRLLAGRNYRLFSTLQLSGTTYPAALVKRGIISGFDNSDSDSPVFYVDGINNPGFSGGPVVFFDSTSKRPKVLGVVSARVPEELMTAPGVPPPPVGANSGIVIVHNISGAVSAIRDRSQRH